jgi:transposase
MVYRRVDSATKSKALNLHGHWTPAAVAGKAACTTRTVQRWQRRVQSNHGLPNLPRLKAGPPRQLCPLIVRSLLEYQKQHPWAYLDELALYCEEEWGVSVSNATISRLLKRELISRKKGQFIGPQSKQFRIA